MSWRSIRLELASTGQFPAGSVSRAYLIRLPLDDEDILDEAAMAANPARATVQRHWATEPDEHGTIVPSRGDWAMRCASTPDRVLQLGKTPLRLGQTLSVMDPDGSVLPFRIASIR